ncbi:MAG: ribose-5-phosphate isomerase [Candidatus Komeilibacteria bacterium CG11_big_fil_rev_8_21_14_0_20_36_20]|uniref:Ribose-5-phosphate isomerase n=1 Tax=Candidatus Komeilibacteria bacterium CG11_big_fil_rev_8_21_14_0_20_36_20 TaxID=1974477 RepID=A0A2H0NC67_9BACT|nr:MAG: ribose-5-phosphate isomerase [Candidatus Komeilibacteria bacterium CG11_big_fil_rev_8_21_14_0_20_36_20]PIR81752.1 MAG: ribose 5-phosphate isomerase B [Candidatus Komeilibacteria bacterium CG10_big_fil_rev_8_21_14_0_10_36_65]PJC55569.1 MAG: ribose 5-phosphate isomerase B [Candidatus Komeilibacteria bacterium CG_4_9_14_0_2_um_filter_36_13]
MKTKKIYLGADHAGFKLKEAIKKYFDQKKITYQDLGNYKFQPDDDYPDLAKKVAKKINKNNLGILICGSGQGMVMTANKFKNVRAALGYSIKAAGISRQDNDSNLLCLAGWFLTKKQALKIIEVWLNTSFSNLARHKRRVRKIN